jgi:beta-lactamase regulating signal transducer with metallopeptidase domain
MAYLIKVSLAWAIFLLLFEVFYKNNSRFTANRIYLLLTMIIGMVLPAIHIPVSTPTAISAIQDVYTAAQNTTTEVAALPVQQHTNVAAVQETGTQSSGIDIMLMIGIVYCLGVLVLFIKCLVEIVRIRLMMLSKPVQILYGYKVITTGKVHSPYSFMDHIFLTDTTSHNAKELEYIIRHEAAHNTRKHWLDLWAFQLACIVFWFHPLIWRYRYLLQLQHEYEADAIAANQDPYTYGRFLLQQTLLKGVPSVTHSFHFSPIKNRINMLTKKQNSGSGNWKYLVLLPAMLGCSLLMATTSPNIDDVLPGNQTVYKGNTFTLKTIDTSDKRKDDFLEKGFVRTPLKPQVVVSINDEPVYQKSEVQTQAVYNTGSTSFAEQMIDQFHELRKNTIDSMTYIVDMSLVVDKEGNVVYYNARYARPYSERMLPDFWNILYDVDTHPNVIMDKIISQSPKWKPAIKDGNPVNSYVAVEIPGC